MIQVFDDFLPNPELVRQSAIRAGFGPGLRIKAISEPHFTRVFHSGGTTRVSSRRSMPA